MKYQHICSYVASTPWAILPDKLAELLSVLAFRAAGHEFTADEIRARIGDGGGSAGATKRGAVAVLPLRGVIAHRAGTLDDSSGGTSTERFTALFRQVVADPGVATIIIDCDSPGGTVPGCSELAAEIFTARSRKHLVAIANACCCSAAYWICSQAHEIVSIPSGLVGSVGVLAAHSDLSKALEQEGVTITLMSAGLYKTENNPFQPLTPAGQAQIQGRVDEAYASFAADVARGRGVTPASIRNGFGQGRALSAPAAKAAGLIDRIATFDGVLGTVFGSGQRTIGAHARLIDDDRRRRLYLDPVGATGTDGADDIRRRRLLW